jgi:hypothetical protein
MGEHKATKLFPQLPEYDYDPKVTGSLTMSRLLRTSVSDRIITEVCIRIRVNMQHSSFKRSNIEIIKEYNRPLNPIGPALNPLCSVRCHVPAYLQKKAHRVENHSHRYNV